MIGKRRQQKAAAMKVLLSAIRNLINIAIDKLAMFRRLFGYRMSGAKQAAYQVVRFYTRNNHPRRDEWVPSELVKAMALLGLEKFNKAKKAGELIKATGETGTLAQMRMAEQAAREIIPQSPTGRRRKNRGPHLSQVRIFSWSAYRLHPYATQTTMVLP